MTATDWLEVAAANLSNSLAAFAITVTIASGYLIMAYMIGKKLTVSQVWILNTLFLLVTSVVAFGDFESLSIAARASNEAGELLPSWRRYSEGFDIAGTYISLSANIFIIGACLKFMWDIRHNEE